MLARKITYDDFVDEKTANGQLQYIRKTWTNAKNDINKTIQVVGVERWGLRTSWMEMSKPLSKTLRGSHGIPHDASNAFFKAIELFDFLGLDGPIRLFDNASLPGDFIRASQWKFPQVEWRANSLIGGLDDRFGLIRDHPENWMMDAKMDGDVTSANNRDEIVKRLGDWTANIYTSDLGFSCSDYYREEEEHFNAHVGQVSLGLRVLAPGGAFVVKTFTMFNPDTHCLLNWVMQKFDQFWIVKPQTSKHDNSECYWVGKGYHPERDDLVPDMPVYPRSAINAASILVVCQSKKIRYNNQACIGNQRVDTAGAVKLWMSNHIARNDPNRALYSSGR